MSDPLILRPPKVMMNGWSGGRRGVTGETWSPNDPWGLTERAKAHVEPKVVLGERDFADPCDWRHPDVGWGLIVADTDDTDAVKARGEDLPRSLRDLVEERKRPILRYNPALPGKLRRYFSDGRQASAFEIEGSARGLGDRGVPRYLLIYGAPDKVPWRFQYTLNLSSYVGRLDLENEALDRYVTSLRNGWAAAPVKSANPLVWSVNFGGDDITYLMQGLIAKKLWARYAADGKLGGGLWLHDSDATLSALVAAISERKPGLIITTSHGLTGGDDLVARLGGLVDAEEQVLTAAQLPVAGIGGAIWYAHACCSAGSDSCSQFEGLFPVGNPVGDCLRSVSASAGAALAPLPKALLGAEQPLRAFIGHVEPTFDWTLRDPSTGEGLTNAIQSALYKALFSAWPVGYALSKVYDEVGGQLSKYVQAIADVQRGGSLDQATYHQVVALDRQGTVILGDPTVTLAPEN